MESRTITNYSLNLHDVYLTTYLKLREGYVVAFVFEPTDLFTGVILTVVILVLHIEIVDLPYEVAKFLSP